MRRRAYLTPLDIINRRDIDFLNYRNSPVIVQMRQRERGERRYAVNLTLRFIGALFAGGSVLLLLHWFGR